MEMQISDSSNLIYSTFLYRAYKSSSPKSHNVKLYLEQNCQYTILIGLFLI